MKLPLTEEQKRSITIPELLRLIFRLQKRDEIIHLPGLLEKLSAENEKSKPINEQSDKKFFLKFYEAIALLKRRGLLMDVLDVMARPGDHLYHHIPSIGSTSLWEKSFLNDDGMIILIDDAQEIVEALKEEVLELDPVVEQYYLESLRACQEGFYISSAICLGAASERTVDCLVETVADRYPDHDNRMKGKSISAQIDYLSRKDNFRQIFGFIEDSLFRGEVKDKLSGIAHIYRRNRNEAGHPGPIPIDITRDEQECYLNSFRRYAIAIFRAISMLKPTL